ncbi:hypothetical protein FRC05_009978 [Tulasnella sp. 425]|nr:hypothetical protein FRC05_009978 [Tulasnella sp. 425]
MSTSVVLLPTAATCSIPLVSLAILKWVRPKPIPGIPHYPITSFWGDIPKIKEDTEKYGTVVENGSIFRRALEGGQPIFQILIGPFSKLVLLAEAQELDDFMTRATKSRAIDQSDSLVAALSGTLPNAMISFKTGETWKKHRRVAAPLMGSKYLRQMTPAIAQNAQLLAELWKVKMEKAKANGASCFSCEDDFKYATLDAAMSATTGKSVSAVEHAISQIARSDPVVDKHGGATFHLQSLPICDAASYLFGSIGDTVSLPPTLTYLYQQYLRWTPTFNKHYKTAVDVVNQSVNEHRQRIREARALGETIEADCLIGMIVQNEGQPGQESFAEAELRDEALGYIFAGQETTAMALQWGMKFLTEAPDVQRTLHEELLATIGDEAEGRPLTFDKMMSPEKMPYLEAVVAEILRFALVAPGGSTRQTTEPVDFLGHTIPAGTHILYFGGIASFNASIENEERLCSLDSKRTETSRKNGLGGRELWKTPTSKFEPDRWIKSDPATGKRTFNPRAGFSFPFGIGLRACAGKQLALLELKIYIATLNLVFFLDHVPEELSSHRASIKLSRPLNAASSLKDIRGPTFKRSPVTALAGGLRLLNNTNLSIDFYVDDLIRWLIDSNSIDKDLVLALKPPSNSAGRGAVSMKNIIGVGSHFGQPLDEVAEEKTISLSCQLISVIATLWS